MTTERAPRLSAAQAELLMRRLQGKGSVQEAGSAAVPLVRRGKGEGPAPLSYAQERLWFQEQLHPDTIAYTTADTVYRIHGPLDTTALQTALHHLITRHETLRSHFPTTHGQPHVTHDPPHTIPHR
ncbi:condensation domain-containing protein, partial [Streptomyces sp. NPDC050759]|uniref:condensation domain-containing protein n=1 Tax=Streptomyces sp. NPDC050759 TaxID=3365635 RepID=UPI0037A6AFD2